MFIHIQMCNFRCILFVIHCHSALAYINKLSCTERQNYWLTCTKTRKVLIFLFQRYKYKHVLFECTIEQLAPYSYHQHSNHSLACCVSVCMNINLIASTHIKTMQPARCNLRDAACGILCRRPQHKESSRLQHRPQHANCNEQAPLSLCVRTRSRVYAHTHA